MCSLFPVYWSWKPVSCSSCASLVALYWCRPFRHSSYRRRNMNVCASLRKFGLPQRSKATKFVTILRALEGILSHLLNMAFERYLRNLADDWVYALRHYHFFVLLEFILGAHLVSTAQELPCGLLLRYWKLHLSLCLLLSLIHSVAILWAHLLFAAISILAARILRIIPHELEPCCPSWASNSFSEMQNVRSFTNGLLGLDQGPSRVIDGAKSRLKFA